MLYLYPFLRETKKQILIDEGMDGHGDKYLELCKVINFFFSDMQDYAKGAESHWENLV